MPHLQTAFLTGCSKGLRNTVHRAGAVATLAISLCFPAPAVAGKQDYALRIVDMPLDVALSVIGRDLNMEFMIDGSGRRRVRGLDLQGTPQDVVRDLMRAMNMDAFHFNGQTYVAPTETRQVRLIRLGDVSAGTARDALDQAGLLVPEFSVSEVADGGALVLSGPVKYLAISESVIASLRSEHVSAGQAVRVRRAGKLETAPSDEAAITSTSE